MSFGRHLGSPNGLHVAKNVGYCLHDSAHASHVVRLGKPAMQSLTACSSVTSLQVYIAPLGVYLIAEAGTFREVQILIAESSLNVAFDPLGDLPSTKLRLRWDIPAAASATVWSATSSRQQSAAPLNVMSMPAKALIAGYRHVVRGWQACCQPMLPVYGQLGMADHGNSASRVPGSYVSSEEGGARQRLQLRIFSAGHIANANTSMHLKSTPGGSYNAPYVRNAYEFTPSARDEVLWVGLTWAP